MTALDDRLTASLLAEYDTLGREIEAAGRLSATQEQTLQELHAGPLAAVPLAEHHRRRAVADAAEDLAAGSLQKASRRTGHARARRQDIMSIFAEGLPRGRWVASGEWALYVAAPSRGAGAPGPVVVFRALCSAVTDAYRSGGQVRQLPAADRPRPPLVVALSRTKELRARTRRGRVPAALTAAIRTVVLCALCVLLLLAALGAIVAVAYVAVALTVPFYSELGQSSRLLPPFLSIVSILLGALSLGVAVTLLGHPPGPGPANTGVPDPEDGPPLLSRAHTIPHTHTAEEITYVQSR